MILSVSLYIIPMLIMLFAFSFKEKKRFHSDNILIIISIGMLIRFIGILFEAQHPTDMNCFYSWSDMLYKNGMGNFYNAVDKFGDPVFTDYPPGYMYVLWLIGFIRNVLHIDNAAAGEILLKLPAIIGDVVSSVFIYKIGSKLYLPDDEERSYFKKAAVYTPLIAGLLYVLNPAAILDSAVWGQVDSIHTLTLIISIYFILDKKFIKSLLLFTLAVLIKPQALMFTPVYLYVIFAYVYNKKFSFKSILKVFGWAGVCLAFAALLLLPFSVTKQGFDFSPVIDQYKATLASYPHVSVNAYNIYTLFDLNWKPLNTSLGPFTYDTLGTVFLCVIVVFSLFTLSRNRSKSNVFYTAVIICISTFMFSVKMHERYAFPMMALLLLSYLYKKDKKILGLYILYSLSFFMHYLDILNLSINGFDYGLIKQTMPTLSFINVILYVSLLIVYFKVFERPYEKTPLEFTEPWPEGIPAYSFSKEKKPFIIQKSDTNAKYTKHDFIAISVISIVYFILAISFLGDKTAPTTKFELSAGESVDIEFYEPVEISKVQYMLGAREERHFNLSGTDENTGDYFDIEVEADSVFKWDDKELNIKTDKLTLTAKKDNTWIQEIAFRSKSESETGLGEILLVKPSEKTKNLFDEQDVVPEMKTYMNGTYFDEVYHARTGYELVEKVKVYEWTHPPLGKNIIALGIKIFGMNPFGWRFMGALFGALMVPFMYLFGKSLFKKTSLAVLVTVFFTFDFMHYAQTRIATIDTYIVFFVILMYWFMYLYYKTSFYDKKLWKTFIPLGLSGICMGLGIASKWPGVYAGAGLAVIFFATLIRRFREYLYCRKFKGKEADLPEYADIRKKFPKYTIATLLFCVVFFIIVPAAIYLLSYIPFYATKSLYFTRDSITFLNDSPQWASVFKDTPFGNYCAAVVQNQFDMFNYHVDLVSEHPYEAKWFTWLFDLRPIFYYSATFSDTVRAGLSSFGNPAVWWGGLAALIYGLQRYFKTLDKKLFFLLIAYFAQLLPWLLIARTTYIYHYFPCVPFLALLVGYFFSAADLKSKKWYYAAIIAVVALFIMFYPLITGIPVNFTIAKNVLEWFTGMWQLI